MNSLLTRRGFTLLEVLIAVAIMAFISIGAAQLYSQTFDIRDTLITDGEFFNEVRLSLEILEKDLGSIYSPLVMLPYQPKALDAKASQELNTLMRGDERLTSDYWNEVLDSTGLRPSRFFGKDSTMSFVAASNRRIYKEATESIFTKIKYELRDDEDPDSEVQEGTKILTKIVSADAFNMDDTDDDAFQKVYPLLRGIKELKFKFYSRERAKWYDEWDNQKQELRNLFPDAVEMEIEVQGSTEKLFFAGTFRYRPEIPLNGLQATL